MKSPKHPQTNMNWLLNNWIYRHIPTILLLLFYFSEATAKYLELTTGNDNYVFRIIKLVSLIYLAIILIKKRDLNFFKTLFIILIFFSIGQIFIANSFTENSIYLFVRYSYPLFLFRFLADYSFFKKSKSYYFLTFESIALINSGLIIIGFVFQVVLFETYNGNRFGYNGLINASANSTYIYIIILFYFFLKQKINNKFDYKIIIILISCLLIGTKTIYLSLAIILFYFIITNKLFQKIKYISLILLTISLAFLFYIFFFKIGILNEIRINKGLLTSILSFRDELLFRDVIPYIKNNWSIINYFFGGVEDMSTRAELGFVDVLYFWGFIGGAFYLLTYYKLAITFKLNGLLILFLIILTIIIFLSGNFFFYTPVAVFLCVFKLLLSEQTEYIS